MTMRQDMSKSPKKDETGEPAIHAVSEFDLMSVQNKRTRFTEYLRPDFDEVNEEYMQAFDRYRV